jgi:hypothetical protein
MMEHAIKFQTNWNKKLGCDYFTTLRLANPAKYQPGAQHKVLLLEKGIWRDYGFAEVVSIRNLRIHQLNEFICGLDTGYGVDETKNILYTMYKDKVTDVNKAEFNLVLYRKIKTQPVQSSMYAPQPAASENI